MWNIALCTQFSIQNIPNEETKLNKIISSIKMGNFLSHSSQEPILKRKHLIVLNLTKTGHHFSINSRNSYAYNAID